MKTITRRHSWIGIIVALLCCIAAIFPLSGKTKVVAKADANDPMEIRSYEVIATVNKDRTVDYKEKIEVYFTSFLPAGATMYYRSLPTDGGDRYFNFDVKCPGNKEFSWHVKDNPDVDGFIDVNCVGGVASGRRWVYEISYTMLPKKGRENGMILDVVGGGTPYPIHNVKAQVFFPAQCTDYKVYSGSQGAKKNDYTNVEFSADKKSITITADKLPKVYNARYGEYMASGVTLSFDLIKGGLQSLSSSQIRGSFWAVILAGGISLALAFFIIFKMKGKHEIIPVVNVKAPKEMDPLRMGKLIDGTVNGEDVTSMIYWFASNGYLKIDFSSEDPVLLRTQKPFDQNAPAYQRVMLEGLFRSGMQVKISELTNKFYLTVDKAKALVSAKDIPRYEKKSIVALFLCGGLALGLLFVLPLVLGLVLMGGRYLFLGKPPLHLIPVIGGILLLKAGVDRKWKGKSGLWTFLAILLVVGYGAVYVFINAAHILSTIERILLATCSGVIILASVKVLSYTEPYAKVMGDVVGFKEFILYTEEDKIAFMLQENPELYYDVLPYAQVLGVTDEWENKFKGILLEPPSWAASTMTVYDYVLLNRCMHLARVSMLSRPQTSSVGRSGGGSSFGGFSGGGSGGGGMGVR